MRISLALSFTAHTVLLIASVVALPAAKPLRVEEPQPVPVEILSLEEFNRLTSKKSASEEKKPVPKPPPPVEPVKPVKKAVVKPKPKTPPKAVEPVAKPQTVAAVIQQLPKPEPVVAPKPEPKPEPVAEPLPEPDPEPVAKPAPKPEPVARPAPPKPEAKPKKPVTTANTPPAPRVKPKPPRTVAKKKPKKTARQPKRKKARKSKPKFNADRIAALLNKLPDDPVPAPAETSGLSPDSKLRVAGLDQRITRSEIEYLRQQISRCWQPPVGIAGAEKLAVKVRLNLRRDGSLAAPPIVLNTGPTGFRVAAIAAVRAANQCAPYDMPGEKFDAWAEVIVNFDPRYMLGG